MKIVKLFDDFLEINANMLGLSRQEYTSRHLSENKNTEEDDYNESYESNSAIFSDIAYDFKQFVAEKKSALAEKVVYNSSNTKPSAAKKAKKEFGDLLPKANKGIPPYVFAVIKTEGRNYRLAIKSGGYIAHEFMTNLKDDGILTADIVKAAVDNIIKLNPDEFNESVVTERFNFSKKEVEMAATLIASAISQNDRVKAKVHDLEYDKGRGAGFEISIDGEKYAGGSYVVKDNGDVVNAAIGNLYPNAVYNTIGNKDIADVVINMKKYESFESFITEKRENVGKYNTVKKVIAELGRRPSEQELATFITNNYYDVTEVERGEDDPAANDKIADLVGFYKFDINDWEIAWSDAQNESVVAESEASSALLAFMDDEIKDGNDAQVHIATFSGNSMEAQSTKKTWDDGVPVTKNFTRGGYKTIAPKGKIWILESEKFWYFQDKGIWYAVKIADYGTPPFEY